MNLRRAPMRFWLPVFSLVLWVALVAVPMTLVYTKLVSEAHGEPAVTLKAGSTTFTFPHDKLFTEALRFGTWKQYEAIEAINLPAFSIELLISRLSSSWPGSWAPAGLDFRTWRAISFPIFCLPFWWFEGLGVDGLLKRKHLHWRTFLLGTLLWGLFLTALFGLGFAMSAEERTEMVYSLWGFGLWVLLLSVFPIGWIIRWRNRRPA